MLIGIMADSHEQIEKIKKAVSIFNERGIFHLYHAGDIISPITYSAFEKLKCRIDFIFGNNDGEMFFLIEKFKDIASFHKRYFEFEIDDKKFLMMHEPYLLNSLEKASDFDCIIYGHTHKLDIRKGKPMIINPGEAGGILAEHSSIVILETSDMNAEVIDL